MLPVFDGFAEFMKGGYAKHSTVFYASKVFAPRAISYSWPGD